jgi:hypothetical protein
VVEKAGLKKSFVAIPYIRDETIREMLQFCIETPHQGLRTALQTAYPPSDGGRKRSRTPKEELRRAAEGRALQVIHENKNGMIGNPGLRSPPIPAACRG